MVVSKSFRPTFSFASTAMPIAHGTLWWNRAAATKAQYTKYHATHAQMTGGWYGVTYLMGPWCPISWDHLNTLFSFHVWNFHKSCCNIFYITALNLYWRLTTFKGTSRPLASFRIIPALKYLLKVRRSPEPHNNILRGQEIKCWPGIYLTLNNLGDLKRPPWLQMASDAEGA